MIVNLEIFIILFIMLVLCVLIDPSSAQNMNSVRVFIVEEDSYNYLQNYLHQYDMKNKKSMKGKFF